MLAIAQIAASVRASRAEFERVYREAQVERFGFTRPLTEFAAVGLSADDREAFAQGLSVARDQDWIEPLIHLLVDRKLENGNLAGDLAHHPSVPGNAALEAIVAEEAGFGQPEVMFRGVASGMSWTVKVLIDGAAKGTGILIGPHLVLTAWHVVAPLFNQTAPRVYQPDTAAFPRIQIEFDDFLRMVGSGLLPQPTKRVKAHKDWCVVFSSCTSEELNSRFPDPVAGLATFWDYAIIRLERALGVERKWAVMEGAVVPEPRANIIIFEHPGGHPMRLALGTIVEPDPSVTTAVPALRFLHGCNTTPGASGGPCFNKDFSLFGFHQGEWTHSGGNGTKINRGVPLEGVRKHYKSVMQQLPAPDPSEIAIWRLNDRVWPIIGCDDFQTLAWRSALNDTPRVIVIGGDAASGRTFQMDVLTSMLPASGHLQVHLAAPEISKLEAPELAATICRTAGAAVPRFAPAEEFSTTLSTWLRYELADKTIGALNMVRGDRLVWLRLADLNKTEIQGKDASALLIAIYEKASLTPWLRIVLDGMKGDVPFAVEEFSLRYRTVQPTQQHIVDYMTRAIAAMQRAELGTPDQQTIRTQALDALQQFLEWHDEDASTAMPKLGRRAMRLVKTYLDAQEGQR